ncbi:hypothetical protein AAVH_15376 [Aphelenchoides avenae]|nr:hypothetical protein AAVH_15376 [Aphelenchus avenae]
MSQTKAQALFKCPTCGKEYASHSSIRSHRETHNDKPHEAEQFAKKYKLRAALLEAKRSAYTEIGRCECDKCGKIFPHKNALNYHKQLDSRANATCAGRFARTPGH